MSRILKIAAALAVLASLGACTVVPPRVAYSGPSVGIVGWPGAVLRCADTLLRGTLLRGTRLWWLLAPGWLPPSSLVAQ